MNRICRVLVLPLFLLAGGVLAASQQAAPAPYFPDADRWETRQPAEVGMDAKLLDQAVAWAKERETNRPKDLSDQVRTFGRLRPVLRSTSR